MIIKRRPISYLVIKVSVQRHQLLRCIRSDIVQLQVPFIMSHQLLFLCSMPRRLFKLCWITIQILLSLTQYSIIMELSAPPNTILCTAIIPGKLLSIRTMRMSRMNMTRSILSMLNMRREGDWNPYNQRIKEKWVFKFAFEHLKTTQTLLN